MIYIHKSSEVQTSKIGTGTKIWQYSVILKNAVIGKNCNINFNVFIENDVVIGDNVTIKSGVQLWDGTQVGDNVFIGPNVTFTNDLYPRSKKYLDEYPKTKLNKGCSIGANSTLIAGIDIGEYALIGAGSVVTKNVPSYTMWYGNPARFIGYITKNGIPVNLDLFDKKGKKYIIDNNQPIEV